MVSRNFLSATVLTVATMILTFAAVPVNAAMATYGLDDSNAFGPAPLGSDYITVTLKDGSDASLGDVTFEVNVNTSLLPCGSSGPCGIQKFRFNDASAMNNLVTSTTQFNLTLASGWTANLPPPRNQGDSFGLFDLGLNTTAQNRTLSLVFGISSSTAIALTIADFVDFATGANGSQQLPSLFAAHYAGFSIQGSATTSAWFGMVPIPAAVWLFVSALGLLGFLRHRSRQVVCR